MSMLGRLRRRRSRRAKAGAGVDVETFEYVRVGHTALARAAGGWAPDAPRLSDFTLEVSVEGDASEEVRALVEAAPPGRNGEAESWQVAFPTSLEVVEHPAAEFALLAGDDRIALEPPLLRELQPGDPGNPVDDDGDLGSRVREAEAGLRWIQDQLARERDRRRAVEQEIEAARAERDARASEAERVAALEGHVGELEARLGEREDRIAELEREASEMAAERERLLEDAAEGALSIEERQRLRDLEEETGRLSGSLEESQKALAVAEDRYREARQELNRVRAGSEALNARLEAAVEAARALGAEAQPEPEPAAGAATCPECNATGACATCDGKGKRRGRKCARCGGIGQCRKCGGTGYVLEEEEAEA